MNAIVVRLARGLGRFTADHRGVSAVEFALLLPLLLTLYLGSTEVSAGIAIDRKVALTAHTLADLASQYTSISNSDMSNILSASSVILAPYPVTNLQAVVSELSIDAQGNATVVWSDTLGGTARAVGQVVTIPTALAVANSYLILGEVQYSYNPTFAYVLTNTVTLQGQMFMRPRQSNAIARTAS